MLTIHSPHASNLSAPPSARPLTSFSAPLRVALAMSISINSIAVSAFYQPDVPFTTISSSFLRRNGIPHLPGLSFFTMAAYSTPYVFSTGADIAVVDTESPIDIVLGSDWYNLAAQAMAGHAVSVGQVLVSFPHLDLSYNSGPSFSVFSVYLLLDWCSLFGLSHIAPCGVCWWFCYCFVRQYKPILYIVYISAHPMQVHLCHVHTIFPKNLIAIPLRRPLVLLSRC